MTSQSHDHIVKSYDAEIKRLVGEITRMGDLAAAQIDAAMDALGKRDSRAAQRVADNDDALDALEREIGHDVLRLLALRQPIARDLRQILAALRIASDIERIGDYAENIAKRSMSLNLSTPVPLAGGLTPLATAAVKMVREVLHAYNEHDAELAQAIWERDAELDALYTSLFRELLTYMMEDVRSITACTHLLFIAKSLERIGDHATNIAEDVWFAERGDSLKETRKKNRIPNPQRSED
jgi:phosphate transport system protein